MPSHFYSDPLPNPIVATIPLPDGGTARIYWNGWVDAVDGSFYSLSPGFDSLSELWTWIEAEARSITPYHRSFTNPSPPGFPLTSPYRSLTLSDVSERN